MDDYHADNNNELYAWRFSKAATLRGEVTPMLISIPLTFIFVEISNNENILEH